MNVIHIEISKKILLKKILLNINSKITIHFIKVTFYRSHQNILRCLASNFI